jgi:C1A family cysteine protease
MSVQSRGHIVVGDKKIPLKLRIPKEVDHNHARYGTTKFSTSILPDQFSLFDEFVPPVPVWDQGTLGSCQSHATGTAITVSCHQNGYGNPWFDPSRLYMYENVLLYQNFRLNDDEGSSITDIMESVKKTRACSSTVWPYDVSKFGQHPPLEAYMDARKCLVGQILTVPQDLACLKQALAWGKHMVVIGIQVYASFESETVASTGTVPMPDVNTEEFLGGHAIVIGGYDNQLQQFICQNSWGYNWGKQGQFTLPYDYVLNPQLAGDFWVLDCQL